MDERHGPPKDAAGWDRRYVDGLLPWDTKEPDPHMRRVLEDHRVVPGRALEIGCGTGTNSIWLDARGFEVTGLDLSPTAIEMAGEKIAAAGASCQVRVGDFLVDEIPEGPFGFVYDRGCFHVFDGEDDRAQYAAQVASLLSPDGIWHSLIGSTDGPPRDTGPPRRSAAQIAAAVEPFLEILELRSVLFDDDQTRHARGWILVARRRATYP